LNAELGKCNHFLSSTLPEKERQYVTLTLLPTNADIGSRFALAGLGLLMESMLIADARHLSRVNAFGVRKITRNILALQQSIKSITNGKHHTDFERAKLYYSLFSQSPPVSFLFSQESE
jgi:exocyst complex component 4